MMFSQRAPTRRDGTATVEMALVLPLLLLLLVGMWEVGRMVEVQQLVSNAAREGARMGASGQMTFAELQALILSSLNKAGITNQDGIIISIRNSTTSDNGTAGDGESANYDPSQATQLDQVEVTVQVPYANIEYTVLGRWFFPDGKSSPAPPTYISGRAEWASSKDIPITVVTDIPTRPQTADDIAEQGN